jgi:hypothetical protein
MTSAPTKRKSARFMQRVPEDTTYIPTIGKKYGYLTPLMFSHPDPGIKDANGRVVNFWYCKCVCGENFLVEDFKFFSDDVDDLGKEYCRKDHRSLKSPWTYDSNAIYDVNMAASKPILKTHLVKDIAVVDKHCHFDYWKSQAKKREIPFTVTEEYLWELFLKQDKKCALTGVDLLISAVNRNLNSGSLDRINSRIGYEEGNLQWVHKTINMMKYVLKQDTFIDLCVKVADFKTQNPTPVKFSPLKKVVAS